MKYLIAILFVVSNFICFSQKILEITITHGNHFKSIQIFNNSFIEYKLKGDHKYRINKIVNLKDSIIIFQNDSTIKLSEIKSLKLRNGNHLYKLFGGIFYTAGIGLITIDTFNNIINNDTPYINQSIALASAALLGLGVTVKQLSIKRVRINKHRCLRILDIDYQSIGK